MTPGEKAKELVEKMTVHHWTDVCDAEGAKQCALIAVEEHLKGMSFTFGVISYASLKFWKDVKQEIQKL